MSAKFLGSVGINCVGEGVGVGVGVGEGVGVGVAIDVGVGVGVGCDLATGTPLLQRSFFPLLIQVYTLLLYFCVAPAFVQLDPGFAGVAELAVNEVSRNVPDKKTTATFLVLTTTDYGLLHQL